ncbi:HAMP domain-containing histidine kinase [Nocardioides anomalus]|uniref:histidine kinase n=1 Tax=Nocardioides anomalus TaxID=2712223 RepID=A0A6G6W9L5_9ACTN|nr:ATP-binding protein [Nocardioides anomalus]QIG41795.1 HAMP domain-containing histidine kinase [Nocardioides anomalus]
MARPYVVNGARAADQADPRVEAVLEVLTGRSLAEVAAEWRVEPALLGRWVRSFVDAGTAAVTNRPDPDAARQRDRFLAAFAHEVRTPLTVALGWLSLLAHDDVPPHRVATSLQRLHGAVHQLAERTRDVELMATASLGRLRLAPEPVTVTELAARLDPAPEVHGGGRRLSVDPDLFATVLRDLWAAAATAPTPTHRRIEVAHEPPWDVVRVVRHGDPIDARLLQALFEPFDLNDDRTGVTIGLYLVRALVVLHGGSVGVEQDDHTATFWVRIPERPPHGETT